MRRMSRRARMVGLALAVMAAGTVSLAQTAQPVRVRGTVVALDGPNLVVASREGGQVTIRLADNWGVSGIRKAELADIKPGTFVGTAAMARGDAPMQALEVLVFPPGARSGEGHYGWDLLPESTMTNATVASTVDSVSGPVLTLSYPGGEKRIAVTPDIPIVTFAPAEKSDIKPGAPVFVPSQRAADGTFSAARVIVGNNGIAPPM